MSMNIDEPTSASGSGADPGFLKGGLSAMVKCIPMNYIAYCNYSCYYFKQKCIVTY